MISNLPTHRPYTSCPR